MTARQVYEALLIEMHKENAPNILLEDFNYLFNKSITQYINKRYNIYDINQQTTDDLRVLKSTAILTPDKCDNYDDLGAMMGATYEVQLPDDYFHILNCVCVYNIKKTFKCYNKGQLWRSTATRLTADSYSLVLDNFWNKPSYKKPYYYIHNVNNPIDSINTPTNALTDTNKFGTDVKESLGNEVVLTSNPIPVDILPKDPEDSGTLTKETLIVTKDIIQYWYELLGGSYVKKTELPEDLRHNTYLFKNNNKYFINDGTALISVFKIDNKYYKVPDTDHWGNAIINTDSIPLFGKNSNGNSTIEKAAKVRYGNATSVRMEIRYGTDTSVFELKKVYIDYVKTPLTIRLTLEQLDMTEDTSQSLEFPDYVCQEIINELVKNVMENISDPRIQTHPLVNLSIANPAQQLTETAALSA